MQPEKWAYRMHPQETTLRVARAMFESHAACRFTRAAAHDHSRRVLVMRRSSVANEMRFNWRILASRWKYRIQNACQAVKTTPPLVERRGGSKAVRAPEYQLIIATVYTKEGRNSFDNRGGRLHLGRRANGPSGEDGGGVASRGGDPFTTAAALVTEAPHRPSRTNSVAKEANQAMRQSSQAPSSCC